MASVAPPVEGRRWLAPTPLTPSDLDGRVVVITFWSFACEASLRAVENLQDLVDRHHDRVVGLAVHTPRFPFEDDERRLMQAVTRHRIGVPVIHDPDYLTWNRYNPAGWPATVVVDRSGRVIGASAGLDGTDLVVEAVAAELAKPTGRRDRDRADRDARASTTSRRPSPLVRGLADAEWDRSDLDRLSRLHADTSLWFPSAVAATDDGLVAVADRGNDRLLIGGIDPDHRTFRPDVEITDVDQPTALVFGSHSVVYTIESGTSSILQIDLGAGTVDVVADSELSIPTDLTIDLDGSLVVADAGRDQLIRIVGTGGHDVILGPIAGCGVTGCRDGAADQAELAQPVAVERTAKGLVFCDAASSNVRILSDDGDVRTVTGNEFYDWGLVDGPATRARLQRPTGLAVGPDGSILIADAGNDRVRLLADRQIQTLGLAGLDQPTGLAVLPSDHLLVADTGNHRLVVADRDGCSAWPVAVYPARMTSVWEDDDLDSALAGADDSASAGQDDAL
ncbi:MAG: thioredoxin-like domain-containing protein [Actinomycetota bacterium]